MNEHVKVSYLIDIPEALPQLVQWFIEAWSPHYGPSGIGDARADLVSYSRRDGLPVALVAQSGNDKLLGVTALKPVSLPSHEHLGPWLGALLVTPGERGKGIATVLIGAIEAEARRQGITVLYSDTVCTSTMLSRLGWQAIEENVPTLRDQVTIYRRDLSKN